MSVLERIKRKLIHWLAHERRHIDEVPLCDFERIKFELRTGDIILVEGRSRISEVIKMTTQSSWSHTALYVGRLHDIPNPLLRDKVREFYHGPLDEQLIIESLLGYGTIVNPLSKYNDIHLRICRPKGISSQDAQAVIDFSIGRLGMEYGVRHIFDLARFLLPWSIFPKRWRSSLFTAHVSIPTKEICSSMLAEAFASVHFPILPIIKRNNDQQLQFYQRNPRLFTPRDFDYSPFFEIIKYPLFDFGGHGPDYRHLPWNYDNGPISSIDEVPIIPVEKAANDTK